MEKGQMTAEEIQKFTQESFKRLLEIKNNPKWEQFEDDPCNMFSLENEGRLASKGEAIVNATVKQIEEFLADQANHKLISKNVLEFKTLQDFGDAKIKYRRHEGSWPVQDRDFIMCTAKKYDGETLLIATRSIDYEYPVVKDVTRATIFTGGYIIQKQGQKSKVIYISDADLNGSIPGMLKSKISKSQAEQPAKIRDLIEKK